jgi:putative oxidoreductase
MTGLLFLQHGTGKLFGFPVTTMQEHGTMLYLTGLMELIGGALITIGFLTRPVAFILSGYMAFAYFLAHAPRSFFPLINMGEPAVLYSFVFPLSRRGGPRAVGDRQGLTRPTRASNLRCLACPLKSMFFIIIL